MIIPILSNETIEDLQYNQLYILQKKDGFRFGTDAILLADYVKVKNNDKVVDFGSGTGIISILLSQKAENLTINAFEIQNEMADMSVRSIKYNQLEKKITVHSMDYRKASNILGKASQNVVVCNPPYGKYKATILSPNINKLISKHEMDTSIEETIASASEILIGSGRFYLCFPANWIVDLFELLRKYKLEPKKIRLIQSNPQKNPYLVLIESVKFGKSYIEIQPTLIIQNTNGEYTDELNKIYHIKMNS